MPASLRRRLRDPLLDRIVARSAEFAHPVPPVTFTDKVRYKIVNDRRPLLTTFADKVAVRAYVERKIGRDFLTERYLATDDLRDVRADALPRQFALKPSHGSGACLIVRDEERPDRHLPEKPVGWKLLDVPYPELDWDRLQGICAEWLGLRFRDGLEWAYRHIPPRIVAEELLLDGGEIPWDFKFFVLDGTVRMVQVDSDRFGRHRRDLYSPTWAPLEVEYRFPRSGVAISPPEPLELMIELAEKLGAETDFVRVDLYDVAGRVVFGELTNYPGGGLERFSPDAFDEELGRHWTPPPRYR